MIIHLALAVLLPLAVGYSALGLVFAKAGVKNRAILLGDGFLVGMLALTVLLRLLDAPNQEVGFIQVIVLLGIVAAIAIGLNLFLAGKGGASPLKPAPPSTTWQNILVYILFALVAIRYLGILAEVSVRPIFAWDAISSWIQRAQEWYLQAPPHEISPDWDKDTWHSGPRVETVFTYPHPYTSSLISLWGMMAVGSHEHPLLGFFWAIAPLFMASSIYGHLRAWGCSKLAASVGFYAFATLPYVNTHAILHGYAELWMAYAILVGTLQACLFWNSGHKRHLIVGLGVLLFCLLIKRTGLIFFALILAAIAVGSISSWKLKHLAGAMLIGLFLLAAIYLGIDFNAPLIGHIAIQWPQLDLGGLGTYQLTFNNSAPYLLESMLVTANWNILFYFLLPAIYLGVKGRVFSGSPIARISFLAPLFIIFFLYIVSSTIGTYRSWVSEHTLTNRVILYSVPLFVFCFCFMMDKFCRPISCAAGSRNSSANKICRCQASEQTE